MVELHEIKDILKIAIDTLQNDPDIWQYYGHMSPSGKVNVSLLETVVANHYFTPDVDFDFVLESGLTVRNGWQIRNYLQQNGRLDYEPLRLLHKEFSELGPERKEYLAHVNQLLREKGLLPIDDVPVV